jgi:hypothetical protein
MIVPFITLQTVLCCTRSTAPLSGCLVVGTACRPARPSGHSPGEGSGGKLPTTATSVPPQRSARSGSEQPVMRSLRRNHGRPRINSAGREIRETVRAKLPGGAPDARRSGRKEAETSRVDRQQYTENRKTSTAEAATERSEGVAGAERGRRVVFYSPPMKKVKKIVQDAAGGT